MEIGYIVLIVTLASLVTLGEGIVLIRKDIEEIKELINKKL